MHNTAKPANGEHRDKRDRKEHCRVKLNISSPKCANPVEDFHSCWNSDKHRGHRKSGICRGSQANSEHVVAPHEPPHESDHYPCKNNEWVTK